MQENKKHKKFSNSRIFMGSAGRVVATGAVVGFSLLGPALEAKNPSNAGIQPSLNATFSAPQMVELGCKFVVICGLGALE